VLTFPDHAFMRRSIIAFNIDDSPSGFFTADEGKTIAQQRSQPIRKIFHYLRGDVMRLAFLAAIFLCYWIYGAATLLLPMPWAEFITPYAGIAAIIAWITVGGMRARARANTVPMADTKKMSRSSALLAAMLICFIVWAYFATWFLLFYGLHAITPPESAAAAPIIGLLLFFVFHAVLFWLAPRDASARNNDDDNDDDDTVLWIIGAFIFLGTD
jgi:hypothetical protein